ncbi:MAG: hypothetical protein ACYTAN_15835 [Planctomycetota bacterium]
MTAPLGAGVCYECYKKEKQAWRQRPTAGRAKRTKYRALSAMVAIYYFAAIVCLVVAVAVAAVALDRGDPVLVGAAVLGGAFAVLSCFAAAELIILLLDMEENTRNCYSVLSRLWKQQSEGSED